MKIYILDQIHPAGAAWIAERADTVGWDDPRAGAWHGDADGIIVRLTRIGRDDFARARGLRMVSKQGVGIENVDLVAAREHGVVVSNTPGVNSDAVAEFAFALGLAAARRVAEYDRAIRAGETVNRNRTLGLEMGGKRVGVIGMGNIGTRIARKWRGAFDAEILGYDPYVPADRWADIPHRRVATLDALLSDADLVTIHAPLTPETKDLIAARELALMKPTAVLVNAARGGIVNEAALYDALAGHRLFAAGLDVFEEEPPTAAHPLASLPNAILAPHAAASTAETQERSSLAVARQLFETLNGAEAPNRCA